MRKLTLETATVRIAAFPEGGRLLTVRATCFGPTAACLSARLVPRRHAVTPEDGLWDIDLVCAPATPDEGPTAWRDVVFTGEADWCEGVRLHSPGGVLEHRMDPQASGRSPRADRAAARQQDAVARAPAPPPPGLRSRFDVLRVAMDGVAAAMLLAGLALLPMALPANAAEPSRASSALAADPTDAGRCHHRSLLAHLS
jgi:hypothetical protein